MVVTVCVCVCVFHTCFSATTKTKHKKLLQLSHDPHHLYATRCIHIPMYTTYRYLRIPCLDTLRFLRIPCLDVAGVLLWTLASQMPYLPSGEAWASLSLYWMRTTFWLSVNQRTRMLRSLATIECRTLSTAFNSRHVELCLASVSDH